MWVKIALDEALHCIEWSIQPDLEETNAIQANKIEKIGLST